MYECKLMRVITKRTTAAMITFKEISALNNYRIHTLSKQHLNLRTYSHRSTDSPTMFARTHE